MNTKPSVVLVVDDEPINLEIIAEHLDGLGYAIDTAGNGEEALALLERSPARYDAMLLDHMMPVLDGLTTLGRIKADPRFRHLPVIMQTAAASPEKIAQGLELGAHYYLTKPYEGGALRTVLRTALDGHAESRALADKVRAYNGTMPLLCEGRFQFKTLADARQLAAVLASACPDSEIAAIGLTELLVNAVEHGNLAISYKEKSALMQDDRWEQEVERRSRLPENAHKVVEVHFERAGGTFRFVIKDTGPGFDVSRYLELAPDRAYDLHGRGIAIARKMSFSKLEYRGAGNEVVAVIVIDPQREVASDLKLATTQALINAFVKCPAIA